MYDDRNPFSDGGEGGRMENAPDFIPEITGKAKIRVIGVGGAGNNAVNRMIDAGIKSTEYVAVNTDAQILACNKAHKRIQIGRQLTKGLGAGADPEIGRAAAEESKEELVKAIENTDLLFITAGMGGGTGTGAAPVIAKLARDLKILTVAVVTQPFEFEGRRRADNSMRGLNELRKYVDTIIIIPNDKIAEVVPKNASLEDALCVADDVLRQGIRGIADLISTPSVINLDFADLRTILKDKGLAHMGVGVAKGENRIVEAVRLAVNSPLLNTTIEGATGVIINVAGGKDLAYLEAKAAADLIHSVVDRSANIIFGACIDENVTEEVKVTVIATGFPSGENVHEEEERRTQPAPAPAPAPSNPPAQAPRGYGAYAPAPNPEPHRYYAPQGGAQNGAQNPQGGYSQGGYSTPNANSNAPQSGYPAQGAPQNPQGGYYSNPEAQPYSAQGGVQSGYSAPSAPQPPYPESQREEARQTPPSAPEPEAGDSRMPPFVRRMLGKK